MTFGVPEFDSFVLTSRSDGLTVGAEGDTVDRIFMALEGVQQLTFRVPQFDSFVITSRSDGLTVGAEGDTVDRIFMTLEGV